jgi:hypothetical protein
VHHAIQPAFKAHTPYMVLLVDLDTQKGKPTEDEALRVLANLLGMRPENLSRSFAELASLGVRVDGAAVTIADIGALSQFARPDPLIDSPHT